MWKQAVQFQSTGRLPQNWDSTASESEQSSQTAEATDGMLRVVTKVA